MITNSFPRTQGQLSREQYLTLLLLALLNQSGGELHISAQSLEAVDSGGKLLVDWDAAAQQAVLRVGSPTLVVAEVRGSGWTALSPQPAQPSQPSPPNDPSKHRSPLSDEQIAKILADWRAKQNMKIWREEGAAVVANMPEPEPEGS